MDAMEAQPEKKAIDKLRHVVSEAPRVMVVDGSKLVRRLSGDVLRKELPEARIVACAGLAEARAALAAEPVDLVTTSLVLPDGDGLALAHAVREAAGQCPARACFTSRTAAWSPPRPSACLNARAWK